MSKNPPKSTASNGNAFKRAQVRHRRQGDAPHRRQGDAPHRLDDLDELIDFGQCPPNQDCVQRLDMEHESSLLYLGPIYTLHGGAPDGFLYAPNALHEDLQQELSHAAVTTYCEAPHVTNIDSVPPKPHEQVVHDQSMWSLWKQQELDPNDNKEKDRHSHDQPKYYKTFGKLSWATTGYHYDWTKRSYDENAKSEMPPLMEKVSCLFAQTAMAVLHQQKMQEKEKSNNNGNSTSHGSNNHNQLESSKTSTDTPSFSFTPSASIVNYYNPKSLMGGHRDDLEMALDKPVVSWSLGRPAIFLLGGLRKDDTPIFPILVRPGDVMILGGASRLAFHGMARLLPESNKLPSVNPVAVASLDQQVSLASLGIHKTDLSAEEQSALQVYLSQHRINMNIRQVYPDDHHTTSQNESKWRVK